METFTIDIVVKATEVVCHKTAVILIAQLSSTLCTYVHLQEKFLLAMQQLHTVCALSF